MPIYGYICKVCEHTLDALQKVSDEPLVDCPACGAAALKRELSAPRFRLKGSGWYETDFKKDKQRNIAGDKQPDKKPDEKSGDGKGEGKAAAKESTESKPAKSGTKPDKPAKTGSESG